MSFLHQIKNAFLKAIPDDLETIIRCIGAPKKFVYLKGYDQREVTYAQDGLWALTGTDFLKDPAFAKAYELGRATGSWKNANPAWRCYVACWAAENAKKIEGDFVECGVNKGGMSLAIMHYTDFNTLNKKFWLLDTYKGFDIAQLTSDQKERLSFDYYDECYESVVKTFNPYPNAKIIRGTVPDTLHHVETDKVAYLSIDMNIPQPEVAALDYFWEKLVPGAIVVLDDYNWPKNRDQKTALDRAVAKFDVKILEMPTGQGLIVKT